MADIQIQENIVFGQGGGRDLRLDVYRSSQAESLQPAVVMLHGGGWRRGSKDAMRSSALLLAAQGFTCVASEYRLNGESRWPAQRSLSMGQEDAGELPAQSVASKHELDLAPLPGNPHREPVERISAEPRVGKEVLGRV